MLKRAFCISVTLTLLTVMAIAQGEQVKVSGKATNDKISVTYTIPAGMHQSLQKDLFTFEIAPVAGIAFGDVIYPEGAETEADIPEYHGKVVLSRPMTVTALPSTKVLDVTASYQVCLDSGMCRMPESVKIKITLPDNLAITPAAQKPASQQAKPSASTDTASANTAAAPASATSTPAQQPSQNIFYMILLAFLGGLILNLMPCVLPVLSIKMLSIVNSASKDRKSIMKGGFIYTAGILVSFAIMAAVVILIKKSGENVGWGFQFQNPYFVFGLLTIIWAFALSLLGVYHIQLPGANAAHKASSGSGMTGTFMSGVFAVLLATPCTAPMLGSAIGFTLKQSAPIIFLMMMIIGLGLAFPFILLGLFPSAVKIIPKPGNWMNVFSNLMGFLLLGTAIFLARTLSFIVLPAQFINTLWFLLVISFCLWLYGIVSKPHIPRRRQWIGSAAALLIALACGSYIIDFSANANTESQQQTRTSAPSGNWQIFAPQKIAELHDAGTPVFVDFSAEWCMTCKANERAVLNTADIQQAFKSKGVKLFKGDFTKKDPVILEWLGKYNRGGVPLYLLFIPEKQDAVVFPEIITKQMILKALDKNL
jgi:thiol:disulfide interchange protein DsbD